MNKSATNALSAFKQRAPLGFLVHDVARLMKRHFEENARAHGITLPQWRALACIAANEGITQVALAQAIDANPMTISGIVDRLEKRGLILRYADPTDNRAKLARLTDEGGRLIETTRNVGAGMYEAAISGVDPKDMVTAVSVLERMRENLIGQTAGSKED